MAFAAASGLYGQMGHVAQGAVAITVSEYYIDGQFSTTSNFAVVTNVTFTTSGTQTVNLPAGDFFRYGVSGLVTGNTNSTAGTAADTANQSQNSAPAQPSLLGLALLSFQLPSSDTTGVILPAVQGATRSGTNEFNDTATVNTKLSSGDNAVTERGDVQGTSGNVGIVFLPAAGAPLASINTTTGTNIPNGITMFATDGNGAGVNPVAALGALPNCSTAVFTNLQYKAVGTGSVTITPSFPAGSIKLLSVSNPGATDGSGNLTTAISYTGAGTTGVTLQNLPQLVINIASGSSTHSVIMLSSAINTNYGVQLTNGTGANQAAFTTAGNKLTLTGGNGSYLFQQATNVNNTTITNPAPGGATTGTGATADSVSAAGFNPVTDTEIYALDVVVGGTQASSGQIATLVGEINGSAHGLGQTIASATMANDPFPAQYNIFLTFPNSSGLLGSGGANFLGFDFSNGNDSNLTGYTVDAVAVVPEPMSLGVLALGGVGLLARRRTAKK